MSSLPSLKQGAKSKLDTLLHEAAEKCHVPAVFFGATNAKEEIYFNQAGLMRCGDSSSGQVTEDTVTELFSQTKFITSIAALQLVDRGLVSLDDPSDIEKHLPEIGTLSVVDETDAEGNVTLRKPKNKVTLRMLLAHTSGFGYPHADPVLVKWRESHPVTSSLDPSASVESSLCVPLLFEPNTSWRYGQGIDWVGALIARISGMTLEEYFIKNIFEPCGITTITFYPTDAVKKNKMAVCLRDQHGNLHPTEDGFAAGRPTDPAKISKELLSGGGGLYGTQRDYLTFLRHVLRCDPKSSQHDSDPLISAKSYAELYKPCVPGLDEGSDGLRYLTEMVTRPNYFDPPANVNNVNHSVGFMINLEDFTGRRKAGSGAWSGMAKTQFWIDPTTGIAGICGTQLVAPAPDPWFEVFVAYERELYSGLE